MRGSFHEGIFHGGNGFPMKGEPDFLTLLKQDEKLNLQKISFFQLKVRTNIKTQNEQKLLRI